MTWALGIAVTQAAGLRVHPGTMTKSFNVGSAAERGLLAALLAARNFTASERSLEGTHGFAEVMGDEPRISVVTEGLGETYEISYNTYKAYPCGMVLFPIIDGCIQLRERNELDPGQIERIDLQVNPLVLDLTGVMSPRDGLEAKFSVNHAAAPAFTCGTVGVSQFLDAFVQKSQDRRPARSGYGPCRPLHRTRRRRHRHRDEGQADVERAYRALSREPRASAERRRPGCQVSRAGQGNPDRGRDGDVDPPVLVRRFRG